MTGKMRNAFFARRNAPKGVTNWWNVVVCDECGWRSETHATLDRANKAAEAHKCEVAIVKKSRKK